MERFSLAQCCGEDGWLHAYIWDWFPFMCLPHVLNCLHIFVVLYYVMVVVLAYVVLFSLLLLACIFGSSWFCYSGEWFVRFHCRVAIVD